MAGFGFGKKIYLIYIYSDQFMFNSRLKTIFICFNLGLIYLPAIVSVGYYFEKRRSLAIGIAVCGTGVGTFLVISLIRTKIEAIFMNSRFFFRRI